MTQNNNTSRTNQTVNYLLTYPYHRTKQAAGVTVHRIGTRLDGSTYGTCKISHNDVTLTYAVELVAETTWKVVG